MSVAAKINARSFSSSACDHNAPSALIFVSAPAGTVRTLKIIRRRQEQGYLATTKRPSEGGLPEALMVISAPAQRLRRPMRFTPSPHIRMRRLPDRSRRTSDQRKRSGELVASVWEITNEDLLCSFLNGTRPLQAITDHRRLKVGWG
jgi:hypothetical protein